MRAQDLVCVFDGAEILLGAGQYFGHVGHQPVAVLAIGAVELLDEVEVAEVAAVEHEVVAAPHFGDAVDGEAGPLVEAHAGVDQQQGNHHAVNERAGEQVLWPVGHQPAKEAGLEFAVGLADLPLEFDALALDLKEHPAFLIVDCRAQFGFQFGHLVQDAVDLIVHGNKHRPSNGRCVVLRCLITGSRLVRAAQHRQGWPAPFRWPQPGVGKPDRPASTRLNQRKERRRRTAATLRCVDVLWALGLSPRTLT